MPNRLSHPNALKHPFFSARLKCAAAKLGLELIDALKAKEDALALPKGFAISPVLLHLGPISDALLNSRYFYRIIDIANLS